MKYQDFKHKAFRNRCRKCINQLFGLELTQKDCQYWIYPDYCGECGKFGHIVIGIEPFSRWKVWRIKNGI